MNFLDFRIWPDVTKEVWEDMCDSMIAPRASAIRRIADYPQGDRLIPLARTSALCGWGATEVRTRNHGSSS